MTLLPGKAYHVTVSGNITEIIPENGETFELGEVQNRVDGYIEVVRLNDVQIMIVNEEGKFSKEYNPSASAIAELHKAIQRDDYICGDVVICPSAMLP